jgi:uncharacterized protein YcgL (UPF0745 family)
MAYLGNFTKSEMSAFLAAEFGPVLEEVRSLRQEVANLRSQLHHKHKDLYTIVDIAELFSVVPATVHNWVKKGKLIKYKIEGRTQFKRADVEKLINYSKS